MSRWFRLHAAAMRHSKVLALSDKDFRLWVRLLAIACENGGKIPAKGVLNKQLAMRLDYLQLSLQRLVSAKLIDELADGYEPHDWTEYQYVSDTSTDRVKRFRNRKRNVSETPSETPPDTDTDIPLAKANGHDPDKQFWDGAKGYLGNGALVNKLSGQYGREAVARAVTVAMLASPQPPDRKAYVIGILKRETRELEEVPIV